MSGTYPLLAGSQLNLIGCGLAAAQVNLLTVDSQRIGRQIFSLRLNVLRGQGQGAGAGRVAVII
ncbi:hypothetical protein B738_28932 [Photorhabdus temperata subsp. temperata M1021]|nr:hypothetical protein B738_28932 [Photorhabdus temperata subsp. temperata M1021]